MVDNSQPVEEIDKKDDPYADYQIPVPDLRQR